MTSPTPSDALAVGSAAPDFTLKDQAGNTVTLSGFKEKSNVLLVFYPGDMTPGCTLQLCAIRDDWSQFQTANVTVFGVNHGQAASHQTFAERHSFPFPLLVDKNRAVSEAYGALRSFLGLKLIQRTVVGIDTHGTIVYLKKGIPKNSDILKAFKK